MARAFSDEEKALLRERLLERGKELFLAQGLKKTSLEEITHPLGIAKSSFYLFFASKEDLYLELLIQEREEVERRIVVQTFDTTDDMREGLKRFLRVALQEIESNGLTRRLVTHPDEYALLTRRSSPAMFSAYTQDAVKRLLPFIEQGQQRGQLLPGDPVLLIRTLFTIPLITLHKDAVGEDVYDEVIELLITLVARGMTCHDERQEKRREDDGTGEH